MLVRVHVPPPPLAAFVECLWEQSGDPPSHAMERVVPSATCELVIALHERPLRVGSRDDTVATVGNAALCGAQSVPLLVDTQSQGRLIGVHFKPGGAFSFFSSPAAAMRDACLPLDDLWGAGARQLREQLIEAPSSAARFARLEQALLRRLEPAARRHAAVGLGLRALAEPAIPVAAVTRASGLSPRRFGELFQREVGLAPKVYARLCRFQRVLRQLDAGGAYSWVETALTHGYFDQAHLIRDFRQFAGMTPTAYLAQRAGQPNHIALPPGSDSSKTSAAAAS